MFCAQCGETLTETAKFCTGCGASVAVAAVPTGCPTCRAEIKQGARFCHACGGPLSATAVPPQASSAVLANRIGDQVDHLLTVVQREASTGQRVSLGSAVLALLLFFLPWVDVSCMGVGKAMSGFDLASGGSSLLWLVPTAMIVTLIVLYRTTMARPKVAETPVMRNAVIASGFGGAAVMLLTYLAARTQLKTDPIFGSLASEMLKIRWSGVLALLATVGTSIGGILHQMDHLPTGETQPRPRERDAPSPASTEPASTSRETSL